MLCLGSYNAEKDLPEAESEDARIGTEKHQWVANILCGEVTDGDVPPDYAEDVETCIRYVKGIHPGIMEDKAALVEEEVDLTWIDPLIGHGTADCFFIEPGTKKGHVIDWKFGRGNVNAASENIQGWCYAAAFVNREGLESVTAHIVQAPLDRCSTAEIKGPDAQALIVEMRQLCRAVEKPWAPRAPGEEQCRYCKAALTCPARFALIPAQFIIDGKVENLPIPTLIRLAEAFEPAEALYGAIMKRLHAIAEVGGDVRPYALVPGRGKREWKDGAEAGLRASVVEWAKKKDIEIGPPDALGVIPTRPMTPAEAVETLFQPKELLSPAGLEKVWGKSKPVAAVVTANTTMVPGRLHIERLKTCQALSSPSSKTAITPLESSLLP
jgi:hypothetical protein